MSEITRLSENRALHFTSDTNEAQIGADFIRLVLKRLGWKYKIQESLAGVNKRPDYALITSQDEKNALQPLERIPGIWEHCASVGNAKCWK